MMTELLSLAVLAAVSLLLLASLRLQFMQLPARGAWLDSLAITPQWKFFGQSRVATDPAVFDDFHLLVRSQAGDRWRELPCGQDRPWHRALWNPHLRHDGAMLSHMMALAKAGPQAQPTSIDYLTLLRHCLDQRVGGPDAVLQYAIVSTRGRGHRPLSLRFLSAWHRA